MKIKLNTASIIGRSEEIRKFRNIIDSGKSEFVAICGRRRVGKTFFKFNGFAYERPEILDCYMVFGGVAYYLSLFEKDKSVSENTDYLCFSRSGELPGMQSDPCSWIYKADKTSEDEMLQQGAQIDLLIDRSDKVINVCEMKYSNNEYEITKAYDQQVSRRLEIFRKVTKTKKTLAPVYITPFGLFNNAYSRKTMRSVSLDDLF